MSLSGKLGPAGSWTYPVNSQVTWQGNSVLSYQYLYLFWNIVLLLLTLVPQSTWGLAVTNITGDKQPVVLVIII